MRSAGASRPWGAALAALLALAVAVPVAGGQSADPVLCAGEEPTIFGTGDPDTLTGTPGRDVIHAFGGDDVVDGGGSRDRICGGGGADRLAGSRGFDALLGGPGSDHLEGGRGTDAMRGGPGQDEVFGGLGSDRLGGGEGDDSLEGGTGSDVARGGEGLDRIGGGRGNDTLAGGPGDGDVVAGDLGDDRVLGGSGDSDETLGGLGIDVVNGGPGERDYVEGGYGDDRMIGGGGGDDVGSFATAVARPGGRGIYASLRRGIARGDGEDSLRRLEDLEGSAFADVLVGDRGDNLLDGGPGSDTLDGTRGSDEARGDSGRDRCLRADVRSLCEGRPGRARPGPARRAPAVVLVDPSPAGGAGLAVIGGPGRDRLTLAFDRDREVFTVSSPKPLGIGAGCHRPGSALTEVACGPVHLRHVVVDLGAGADALEVDGSLDALESVRFGGGDGDDRIHGGAGAELIEAGGGADVLRGDGGSDGLIGGIPGPDRLIGGPGSDLLAAGGGCVGGVLRGGAGRDNASFAETPAHPGVLRASLAAGRALIRAVPGCRPVGLARSNEDLEGSFDWDILIGDGGPNSIYGQPGLDAFFGLGGRDTIDARDAGLDARIDCGGGRDAVFRDRHDPRARRCGG